MVVVLDDPERAKSIEQLEGQWSAETGAGLRVEGTSSKGFLRSGEPAADVVVFPSHLLGELAESGQAAPVPRRLLARYDREWSAMPRLARLHEAAWGRDIRAVPLDSPLLVCYYRADLFKQLKLEPPETWEQYQRAAAHLADRAALGDRAPAAGQPWSGTAEPLGHGWASQVLLARAASAAKHPDRYSTLFDIETMEPLVAGPPFVRALEELVAAAKLGPANAMQRDPDAVRTAFWRGECGMALTWPSAAGPKQAPAGVECGIVPLPGSTVVFDPREKRLAPLPQGQIAHVPLLGMAGRMAAVTSGSQQPEAALRLVFWLAAQESGGTARSGGGLAVEPCMKADAAAQYGHALARTSAASQWLISVRIPGREEYLAALDSAVQAAVEGTKTPQKALEDAVSQWRAITDRLGKAPQRKAYRRSLELD